MFETYSGANSCADEASDFSMSEARDTRRQVVRQELAGGYQRYRAMAVRRLRDNDAAEDVVQAFALKALERFEQLRDVKAVHGWLRRLFETTLIDFCRRRGVRCQHEVVLDLDLHDRPHDSLTDAVPDPEGTIVNLVSHLKKEYADVIYRLDLIDQPKEMAARDLNITLNNLTVRAHRARRALRDAVDSLPISYGGIAAASGR
jgi:RNA polymerase sigma-70 factor (ECF subfamily)